MKKPHDRGAGAAAAIHIVRVFDAPRELVFENWIEPEHVAAWFAPAGFTVTLCEIDLRPGGSWRVEFRSDAGVVHRESGEFHEIVRPEKLVFDLTQTDAHGRAGPKTLVTVIFTETGTQTEMSFAQSGFDSAARRDANAEGWGECFRKLDEYLEQMRQVRGF